MWLISSLKSSRYMQCFFTITVSLGSASIAVYTDWSSPALTKLTTDESYAGIKITLKEASWIASGQFLGVSLGSFLSAWLLNEIGRKKSLLLSGVLLFLPWIALTFPVNGLMMILARFVAGLGGSFIITITSLYVGEITDKDIRGKLTIIQLFISTCGSVLILAVGPFVPYKVLNLLCAIFPVMFFCTFIFAPESPYYLVKVGRLDCAKKSLCRLLKKGSSDDVIDMRFNEIKETVENDMKNKTTLKELFIRRDYRKSIGILIGLRTLQQFSGMFAINSYLQTIMDQTNSNLSSDWVSVIYGVVQLPSVLLAAFLVDHIGRRPLLAFSSFGCFISLVILGIYFYLDEMTEVDVTDVNLLPALCVFLYMLMMSVGISPLPYVIFGELFTTNVKAVGVFLFAFYGSGLGFIAVKIFEPVTEAVGIYTMFWFFGGCCFLGIFFSIFLLPETKNKSFAEIQNKLNLSTFKSNKL